MLTREPKGGNSCSRHMGGLDQAEAAVENGEFDWLAPGWGAAVCYLIGDAEDHLGTSCTGLTSWQMARRMQHSGRG